MYYIGYRHLYSPETVANNEKREKIQKKTNYLQNIQIRDITYHSGNYG